MRGRGAQQRVSNIDGLLWPSKYFSGLCLKVICSCIIRGALIVSSSEGRGRRHVSNMSRYGGDLAFCGASLMLVYPAPREMRAGTRSSEGHPKCKEWYLHFDCFSRWAVRLLLVWVSRRDPEISAIWFHQSAGGRAGGKCKCTCVMNIWM